MTTQASSAIAIRPQAGLIQGLVLTLPVTMAVMGVSVLVTITPLMTEHFKNVPYNQYLIMLVMTVPAIWMLIFSPVAGWLADKFGRRTILIAAMILYAAVGTAPTYLDNIYAILLSRCGVGICEAVVMTVTTTMISDYFKGKEREKWLANQTAVSSIAALLIVPFGGLMGSAIGWRGPFYLYGFSLILVISVVAFTWEPQKETYIEGEPAENLSSAASDAIYHQFPLLRILCLCALSFVAAEMFYGVITQNGNALAALGVKDPTTSSIYTDIASIGVPLGTVIYRHISRLHIGLLVSLDFLLIGIGFWFMSIATTPAAYTAWAFINCVGCGIILPTMLVWTTRGLAYEIRGRGNGMWQGAFGIGQPVSALSISMLGAQLGGLLAAFKVLGSVAFVTAAAALVATLIWGRRAHRPQWWNN